MLNKRQDNSESALGPFRALDLTDEKGLLCGRILASMGAEVIKVEPPRGDQARNIPPFYRDTPDPEMSLFYFAYNANKKSITLDIESPDGQIIFRELIKKSDFILESFDVGYMERLGLSYSELNKINPRIIMTSITPFGQTGPYKNYKPSDIMCTAMSGFMYLTGDADRAPLCISSPQAFLMGAAEAAAATMIAHYYRERTGEGQYVDVSIRDSMLKTLINVPYLWEEQKTILKRAGVYRVGISADAQQRTIWRCKNGWISFIIWGGKIGKKVNPALVEWMESEGMANDFLKGFDWDKFDMATATQELHNQIEKPIAKFFMTHTKEEINEEAMTRGVMAQSLNTVEDVAKDPQLEARGFWEEVEHSELGTTIVYPGAFIKASMTPCIKTIRAPLIGEHNEEVYRDELGISIEELVILKGAGVI